MGLWDYTNMEHQKFNLVQSFELILVIIAINMRIFQEQTHYFGWALFSWLSSSFKWEKNDNAQFMINLSSN